MSQLLGSRDGPFHPGELAVQARAGVAEEAERVGRIIGDALPSAFHPFLAEQRMAIAASVDEGDRVWASLLTGSPGFLRALDEERVLVEGGFAPEDPLLRNLAANPALGLLAIDLARRRRLRVNGRGVRDGTRIFLAVEQAYGNCQKYIKPRLVEPVGDGGATMRRATFLDAGQREWIAGADCFFIASRHPERGADASHRGGGAGFVSVVGPGTLSFPDYPGNNMFNTLGNIEAQPKVGLLFLDFEKGGMLQLTGRASLEWKRGVPGAGAGERRAVVSFALDLALETHGWGVIDRTIAGRGA
ncbi:MAG TPA: pyridoxamine 5'-phosphate oxidase family protein, partial [Vicinamibacteria bacterium]|nr:pyridoxamine 5'-phosphate oxidase family protein [Vicinamibacteria bacterium]